MDPSGLRTCPGKAVFFACRALLSCFHISPAASSFSLLAISIQNFSCIPFFTECEVALIRACIFRASAHILLRSTLSFCLLTSLSRDCLAWLSCRILLTPLSLTLLSNFLLVPFVLVEMSSVAVRIAVIIWSAYVSIWCLVFISAWVWTRGSSSLSLLLYLMVELASHSVFECVILVGAYVASWCHDVVWGGRAYWALKREVLSFGDLLAIGKDLHVVICYEVQHGLGVCVCVYVSGDAWASCVEVAHDYHSAFV